MEPGELFVAIEREVEVQALRVHPPVRATIEDAVVGRVDLALLVWPEHRVTRFHERMCAAAHEAGADGVETRVHLSCLLGEERGHPLQARNGTGRLGLEDMERELVRPLRGTAIELELDEALLVDEHSVGVRPRLARFAVDDRPLDLDAEALPDPQGV